MQTSSLMSTKFVQHTYEAVSNMQLRNSFFPINTHEKESQSSHVSDEVTHLLLFFAASVGLNAWLFFKQPAVAAIRILDTQKATDHSSASCTTLTPCVTFEPFIHSFIHFFIHSSPPLPVLHSGEMKSCVSCVPSAPVRFKLEAHPCQQFQN